MSGAGCGPSRRGACRRRAPTRRRAGGAAPQAVVRLAACRTRAPPRPRDHHHPVKRRGGGRRGGQNRPTRGARRHGAPPTASRSGTPAWPRRDRGRGARPRRAVAGSTGCVSMLVVQANLANSYQLLGRHEEAISMRRDVYSGRLEVHGEEHPETLRAANNYALSLITRKHFEEARSLLRKMVPVARRVLGEANDLTLKMRWLSARALYQSRRRHARRSPRGRDDRRGHSSDRAARSRWRAPDHNGD